MAIAGASVVLLAAGCGTSPSQETPAPGATGGGSGSQTKAEQVYSSFVDISGSERESKLIADAKAEGNSVTLYTENDTTSDDIVPAFEAKYGIKANVVSVTSADVRTRVDQERQAGKVRTDLVESLGLDMNQFAVEGVLAPYKSQILTDNFGPEASTIDNVTISTYSPYMVAWNTNKVKPGEEPKSLQDLTAAKWKGGLAMVDGEQSWYATIYKYFHDQGMSDGDFENLMKGIMSNAQVSNGHGGTASQLAAGEFSAQVQTFQFDVLPMAADGAPIKADPVVKPVVLEPVGIGLTKDAEHPAAALLFTDFYLTEGQKMFANAYRMPSSKTVGSTLPWLLPKEDTIEVPVKDLQNVDLFNAWGVAYQNLTQGSGEILPK